MTACPIKYALPRYNSVGTVEGKWFAKFPTVKIFFLMALLGYNSHVI